MLVEPETLVREALVALITRDERYAVCCEAKNYEEALRLATIEPVNLVVTEVSLDGPSGIELIRELQRRKLNIGAIVLSRISTLEIIKQCFLVGAEGYVLKSGTARDLQDALKTVTSGRKYIPQHIQQQVEIPSNTYNLDASEVSDPLKGLSRREREIFHLLAKGLQNSAISRKLYISPRTVEAHRARIIRKLQLSSSVEIVRYAFKHSLTLPDDG